MKTETMEKKYKDLAKKYREQQMQKNNAEKIKLEVFTKLKIVILDLINEILKNTDDDKLVKKTEKIKEMLKTIKL